MRWCFLLMLLCTFATSAQAQIHIVIDQPEDNRFPIAVANIVRGDDFRGSGSILKEIPEIIRNDLTLSGYFFVIKPSVYKDRTDGVTISTIPFSKWTDIGAQAVVKGIAKTVNGRTVVELRLFDPNTRHMQMGKEYTFDRGDWRFIAHRFADEIMQATTGRRGPFATKIAYTLMSKTSKRARWKQIYIMDMDGHNPKGITHDRTYNLAPDWAPDGRHLVFTSYIMGFPDIFVADLNGGQRRRLTANRSTNITPAYSPDGSRIAFSSGQGRDMEIYVMDNQGIDAHELAPSFGIDIAPSFSPDGSEVVFASERGGKLNLYRVGASGSNPRRITFGGQNDSPDWSPDGTRISFCRYEGGVYQVYTMDPDGSGVNRITAYGSNEHPRWSPDSRYLTYSSRIGNKSQIYIMRFDGANKTRITKGKDSTLPDWGPWPSDYWEGGTEE